MYVLCWKNAVNQIAQRSEFHSLIIPQTVPMYTLLESGRRFISDSTVHSLLDKQIAHILRLRVLQELQLLVERLEKVPKSSDNPLLIRKLRREEFNQVRSTGFIPYDNAVAILVVPPVNRNPATRERPQGSMSPLPVDDQENITPQRPVPPLSTLHTPSPNKSDPLLDDVEALPPFRTPLYNGVALFPNPAQRASLHKLLSRLVAIERKIKHRESAAAFREGVTTGMTSEADTRADGDSKASHAFLLCSNALIARRADVAAVAVALWRLRMFEGADWEENNEWYKRQKYRSLPVFE